MHHDRKISQNKRYIEPKRTIDRTEAGRGNISISTLADLCKFCNISLEALLQDLDTE